MGYRSTFVLQCIFPMVFDEGEHLTNTAPAGSLVTFPCKYLRGHLTIIFRKSQ